MRLRLTNGLYVFNYHSFNSFVNDYWKFGSLFHSNYGVNFEKHLVFFNKYLHKVEGFDLSSYSYEKPFYCLTFDDGYKDNYEIALPLIKKYSVQAIFFIATGVIGTKNRLWYDEVRWYYEKVKKNKNKGLSKIKGECRKKLGELKKTSHENFLSEIKVESSEGHNDRRLMMDWSEIIESHESGVIIGSHTHTHPVLMNMDIDEQKKDIDRSLLEIEIHIGHRPLFFSYPEGTSVSFNQDTVGLLKEFGIRYAFTTVEGVNKDINSSYLLKRFGINPSDPVPLLALKIFLNIIRKPSS